MKKYFQKIITVTMIAVMCLCLSVPVFATDISATSSLEVNYHSTNFWDWLVSLSDTDSKTSATDEQTNYINSFGGGGGGRHVDSYSSTSGYAIRLDDYGWWYESIGESCAAVGMANQLHFTSTNYKTESYYSVWPYGHIDFILDKGFTGVIKIPNITTSSSGSSLGDDQQIHFLTSSDDGVSYQSLYDFNPHNNSDTLTSFTTSELSLYPGVKYRLTYQGRYQMFDGTETVTTDGYFYLVGRYSDGDIARMNVNVTDSAGAIGAINGNGNTVSTEVKYLFDESTNTVYNTSTGGYDTASNYEYNYEDRSYTVTTTSGDTMTITYGDENITYTYAPVSGDTITNNYYYLIQDGTPTTSTDPSPSPSTNPDDSGGDDSGESFWEKVLNKIGDAILGIFDLLATIIQAIIGGLADLITAALEGITTLVALFGEFPSAVGSLFSFLPGEIQAVIIAAFTVICFVAILKIFL